MAVLKSCPKHNMVAYLEKTNGNAEFHEIIDFLMRSSIHNALTSDPSPRPSPTTHIPDSIPEDSGGNHGGQSSNDRSISGNKGNMTLQSVYDLCISLCSQIEGKEVLKEIVDAKGVWRTRNVVYEDKESAEDAVSTEDVNKEKLKEKEKGVKLKDVEETERPRPTSTRSLLTLKPLPKIDPKDKGKKKIEEEDESDTESEGIPEAEKKFKQLARDEEMARKVQEDWEAEEVKKLAEEEVIKAALSNEYDFIQARIEADRLLALRLQDEERESKQRAIAIRNRPPTRTQLRNQMMTYLKHVGNKKHSDLKNKTFEEIQALYEKVKRFDESFTAVGSTEDERKIKEMNEGAKDLEQKRLKKKVAKETPKKEDTAKVPAKVDVTEQGTKKRKGGHMKMLARKRKRPQSDVDSDDEHRKCLKIVTFEGFYGHNSPCFMVKSWLVQDQTVSGKDYSNLLMADCLLKTIWFINAPCYGNEALTSPKANELTIPEQTATGKGISNPFMADSLPKTTKPT
ncbi:hypothetical protein Tco_1133334 [Tanacetum coccineum]